MRSRNDGAESEMPILASATLPDLRKNLRFTKLLPLKFRRPQNQSNNLSRRIRRLELLEQSLPCCRRNFSSKNGLQILVHHLRLPAIRVCQTDRRSLHAIVCERESEVHPLE